MNNKKEILLISDLHLSSDRPELILAFYDFLDQRARYANRLIILGDFFEVWLGDDMADACALEVAQHLKEISDSGVVINFIHGNRDFALGEAYAAQCGMTILPEFYVLESQILLCHGDQLCTLDVSYQKWRRRIRHPLVMWILKHTSQKFRQRFGDNARLKSKGSQKNQIRSNQIPLVGQNLIDSFKYDVTDHAVNHALNKYGVKILIHGHTHKPFDHDLRHYQRYVLSDWNDQYDYLCVSIDEKYLRINRNIVILREK